MMSVYDDDDIFYCDDNDDDLNDDDMAPGIARSIPGTPVFPSACKLNGPYGGYLQSWLEEGVGVEALRFRYMVFNTEKILIISVSCLD